MPRRFGPWLRGTQDESLTRMKWAFLLMVALSIYGLVGGALDRATAPLASISWQVGVALFLISTVAASRRMGIRVVGQYVSGSHDVRRVLLLGVLLWATVVASAWISRTAVSLTLKFSGLNPGYDYMMNVHAAPTTAFIIATPILVFLFITFGSSVLNAPVGVTRQHLRGADFATKEDYLAELVKRHPTRPPAAEISGVPFPPGHERMHTAIAASTGAGKTTALRGMLATIRARGDRAIVLDNNSEFMRAFRQSGDIILSPFHEETVGWRLSNEARDLHDWDPILVRLGCAAFIYLLYATWKPFHELISRIAIG